MGVFRQPPQPAQLRVSVAVLFPTLAAVFPPARVNQQQLVAAGLRTSFPRQPRVTPSVDELDLYLQEAPIGLGDIQTPLQATLRRTPFPAQRLPFPFAAAQTTVTGSGASSSKGDSSAGSGSTTIIGVAADRPGSDIASGIGTPIVPASGSGLEKGDQAVGSGSVGSSVNGTGTDIVGNDSSAGSGTTTVLGVGADLSASDRASGAGTTTIVSSGAAISGSDLASGSGNITILGSGAAIAGNDSALGLGVAGDPVGTGSATSGDDSGLGFGAVPIASGIQSGGAVIVDLPKKKRKKSLKKQIEEIVEARTELTEEEVKGMEAIYGAQMRQAVDAMPAEAQPEAVEELAEAIIEPFEIPPSVFAEPEPIAHDPQQPIESEDPENLEDEIALIMAIIEAIG